MHIKLKECVDNDLISRVICNISILVQLWKANQIAWTVRVSVFWKTQSADLSQFVQFELCSCMWIIYMCSISKNVTAVHHVQVVLSLLRELTVGESFKYSFRLSW